jgi:hypothetical protein
MDETLAERSWPNAVHSIGFITHRQVSGWSYTSTTAVADFDRHLLQFVGQCNHQEIYGAIVRCKFTYCSAVLAAILEILLSLP